MHIGDMRQNTNCLKKCCTLGTMLHIGGLHIGCTRCKWTWTWKLNLDPRTQPLQVWPWTSPLFLNLYIWIKFKLLFSCNNPSDHQRSSTIKCRKWDSQNKIKKGGFSYSCSMRNQVRVYFVLKIDLSIQSINFQFLLNTHQSNTLF